MAIWTRWPPGLTALDEKLRDPDGEDLGDRLHATARAISDLVTITRFEVLECASKLPVRGLTTVWAREANCPAMTDYRLISPEMVCRCFGTLDDDREEVDRYAELMTAGLWRPGSVMVFTPEGVLMDGYWRCAAVVKSGVPIIVEVSIFDVPCVFLGSQR